MNTEPLETIGTAASQEIINEKTVQILKKNFYSNPSFNLK